MRKACMLVMLCVLPLLVSAAEVYRYVDPERGIEYSDMPRPGAERIVIPDPPVAPLPQTQAPPSVGKEATNLPAGTASPYTALSITDPANDDTVRDNAGNLIVSVTLSPPLQAEYGHQLQLLLDGVVVASGTSTHIPLSEVNRGTHTLQAVVIGSDGTRLTRSTVSSFYLHRMSLPQIERQRDSAADATTDAQR